MILSTSVSRRYTPPTCTLEITAETSALSRWIGQSVLKRLQFHLSFEDPRQEQVVQISGDRPQLEALGEAVESYVQQLLQGVAPAPASELEPQLAGVDQHPAAEIPAEPSNQKIQLRPQGFLSHELFLGPLANETSGPVVNLSASGLFDLATALEESTAEAAILPSSTRRLGWPALPIWTRVAAIAALFVGVTTTAFQLSRNSGDSTAPVASQVSEPSLLPPPPSPTLPPLQVPPLPVPSTLPQAGPAPPTISEAPTKPAPNLQKKAPTAPPEIEQDIPVQPPSVRAVPLPEVPDIDTQSDGIAADEDTSPPAAQPSESVFDEVPQVTEVRSYFQQRWQPPQGLKQTLEYTLTLNANGSIQQTTPLNQPARTYLDRTPIPLRGETFVSPVQGKSNLRIRLVLGPDGSVKTFPQ